MIDSPHGQEKTSTQKEIRKKARTPQKENKRQKETRAEESGTKEEARES
jgi:hypothetical protein